MLTSGSNGFRNNGTFFALRSKKAAIITPQFSQALCTINMTNISNPNLRPRDVRKIVTNLSNLIVWEQGCDSNNEWVFASLESNKHKAKLLDWLKSKNIQPSNEVVITNSVWHKLRIEKWSNILSSPEQYFGTEQFEIYDSNLQWLLEYKAQEVARFGRYNGANHA